MEIKMFEQQPTLELLFQQLGLPAEAEAIKDFVSTHQLAQDVELANAVFWNASQREFLQNRYDQDDEWAIVVDELNELLHTDAQHRMA